MKKCLFVCLVLCCMFVSCEKNPVKGLPSCMYQLIQKIKSQPVWNPPATIHEYEYKGQTVYLISAPCCDQYTTLVDKECRAICSPGGGITGRGDGLCPDFSEKAKLVRLVWKDERK